MSLQNRVVVRYADGRIVKGTTVDFNPTRPTFHVIEDETKKSEEIVREQLKAIFFVKDLEGNAERRELRGFVAGPEETRQGIKIAVRFSDGELQCGYSMTYSAGKDGFFLFPTDPTSNNLRIFVQTGSAAEICAGKEADDLVQRVLDETGGS